MDTNTLVNLLKTANIPPKAILAGRAGSVGFAAIGDAFDFGRDKKKAFAALGVLITAICDSITQAEHGEGDTTEEKLQKVHDLALEFLAKTRELKHNATGQGQA